MREFWIVEDEHGGPLFSRRRFLAAGTIGVAGLSATPVCARSAVEWSDGQLSWLRPRMVVERSLSLVHRHTDERLNTVYYSNGRYIPGALDELNWLLRDFRCDEVKEIDPRLFDLLFTVRQQLEVNQSYEIYSAYRTPETNALLRREGWGVARNSLHMQGMAVDIAIPGCESRYIANCALELQRGGVGYYGRANFVHLDVGEVRTWRG
jgi:uncharacterized protein YcbK (DUF882 family)